MSQNTTPASTNTTRGDPALPAPGGVAQQYLAGPSSKGDLTGQPRLTHSPSQLPGTGNHRAVPSTAHDRPTRESADVSLFQTSDSNGNPSTIAGMWLSTKLCNNHKHRQGQKADSDAFGYNRG